MTDAKQQTTSNTKEPGAVAKTWEKVQRSRAFRANTYLGENSGAVLSAGMAFQSLFAFFGALWVSFSIFGIFLRGNPELVATIETELDRIAPGVIGENGAVQMDTLLQSNALSWSGIIAAASLIWLVINWFSGMRISIRMLFKLETIAYKNFIILKLRDLLLAILFGALFLLSVLTSVAFEIVTSDVIPKDVIDTDSWLFGWVGQLLTWVIMAAIFWVVLWSVHRLLAEVPIKPKRLWLGCIPGAMAMVTLTVLGSSLLGGATKNPLLASFAVIIGLLLWFNFVNQVILYTSAFIAAGEDPELGLSLPLREKDREERERKEALRRAGISDSSGSTVEKDMLEPAARARRLLKRSK